MGWSRGGRGSYLFSAPGAAGTGVGHVWWAVPEPWSPTSGVLLLALWKKNSGYLLRSGERAVGPGGLKLL